MDHNSGQVSGPSFRFQSVRPDDLCLEGGDLNGITQGAAFHVVAEITDYDGVREQIELTSHSISPL